MRNYGTSLHVRISNRGAWEQFVTMLPKVKTKQTKGHYIKVRKEFEKGKVRRIKL